MFDLPSGALMDAVQSYDVLFYSTLAFQLLGTTLLLAAAFARKLHSTGSTEILNGRDNFIFNIEE